MNLLFFGTSNGPSKLENSLVNFEYPSVRVLLPSADAINEF